MGRALAKAQGLIETLKVLERRPLSSRQLAEHLGVNLRSAQRYLKELSDSGEPVVLGPDGRYRVAVSGAARDLNRVEALAVHSATRLLLHHTRSNEEHYRSALRKLSRRLPEPARGQLERSLERHQRQDLEPSKRNLEKVADAWFGRRVLRFRYRAPVGSGKAHSYCFETYFVEVNPANLLTYVIGFERSYFRREVTLRLDRIEGAELTEETYEIPSEFDASDLLDRTWGVVRGERVEVKVKLSAEAARHLDDRFVRASRSEQVGEAGEVILTLSAGTDKHGVPIELIPWLLGWGEQVEVLEPNSVRELIRARHEAAGQRYR